MNKLTFVRKIDELGRVVLPMELRKILDIKEKDTLEISLNGTNIYMKKLKPSCVFCDSNTNLKSFYDKNVCINCIKNLK